MMYSAVKRRKGIKVENNGPHCSAITLRSIAIWLRKMLVLGKNPL